MVTNLVPGILGGIEVDIIFMGVIFIRHYGEDQGREHLLSPKGSSRSHIPQTDEVRTELNNDNAWRFKQKSSGHYHNDQLGYSK